jgi:hypothetical protein
MFVGIDNGVSATIGIINNEGAYTFRLMPTKTEQNYTKKKGNITRIDYSRLKDILYIVVDKDTYSKVLVERPMVNPKRFQATQSALRALEAVLIALEDTGLSFEYIDSKEWQKALLPKGTKGRTALKKASRDIGCRMFPQAKDLIVKHGDSDGLMIAHYCKLKYK